MADIFEFPGKRGRETRHIIQTVTSQLEHPDPEVLALWKELLTATIDKFPGAPNPTHKSLSIELPRTITQEEADNIRESLNQFLVSYQEDVTHNCLEMLKDMGKLQKEVAEHRVWCK